jgi:hypothetical protein
MIDWSPSEFSRFRLQYNQDKSQQGHHRQPMVAPIHLQPSRMVRTSSNGQSVPHSIDLSRKRSIMKTL